jgi:hypothetical protein
VASPPRDKVVTFATPGTFCARRDWSPRRLRHELQNGWPYRTFPEGHKINWHSLDTQLDVERGEVTYTKGVLDVTGCALGFDRPTVAIEIADTEARQQRTRQPPRQRTRQQPQKPKRPSDAKVKKCFRAIMKERPDDPPDEPWMLGEMKDRLGAPPGRDRVREVWRTIAPEWKRPRGHPRNRSHKPV